MATRRAGWFWLMFIQTVTLAGHSLAMPIGGDDQSGAELVVVIADDEREPSFVVPGLSIVESGGELWEPPSNSGEGGSSSADPFRADGGRPSDRWFGTQGADDALPLRAGITDSGRGSPASGGAASARAQQAGQTAPAAHIQLDERIVEMAREVEQWLVQTVADALDIRRTGQAGQVSFSLAGVDGFQVTRSEDGLALGYDGTTVLVPERAENAPGLTNHEATSGLTAGQALPGNSALGELIQMARNLLQSLWFWLVAAFLLAGKIAWFIAYRWSARERVAARHGQDHRRHEHRHTPAGTTRLPPQDRRSTAR